MPRRQRLHVRAAEAIERVHSGERAEELALHYVLAGAAADPEVALRWLLRAGELAAAQLAWEDAAAHWDAAVELMPAAAPERVALLERLGDLKFAANFDIVGGTAQLEEALARSGDRAPRRAPALPDRTQREHVLRPGPRRRSRTRAAGGGRGRHPRGGRRGPARLRLRRPGHGRVLGLRRARGPAHGAAGDGHRRAARQRGAVGQRRRALRQRADMGGPRRGGRAAPVGGVGDRRPPQPPVGPVPGRLVLAGPPLLARRGRARARAVRARARQAPHDAGARPARLHREPARLERHAGRRPRARARDPHAHAAGHGAAVRTRAVRAAGRRPRHRGGHDRGVAGRVRRERQRVDGGDLRLRHRPGPGGARRPRGG